MDTQTISSQEILAMLKDHIERYPKFAIIRDGERIILEPLDEEDAKPHYLPSPAGEANLQEALAQAERGELYPIETLFSESA